MSQKEALKFGLTLYLCHKMFPLRQLLMTVFATHCRQIQFLTPAVVSDKRIIMLSPLLHIISAAVGYTTQIVKDVFITRKWNTVWLTILESVS